MRITVAFIALALMAMLSGCTGQDALEQRITAIEHRLDSTDARITEVQASLNLDSVEGSLSRHEAILTKTVADVNQISADLRTLNTTVGQLTKSIPTANELAQIKDLASRASEAQTFSQQVKSIRTDVDAIQAQVKLIQATDKTQEDISQLQAALDKLTVQVNELADASAKVEQLVAQAADEKTQVSFKPVSIIMNAKPVGALESTTPDAKHSGDVSIISFEGQPDIGVFSDWVWSPSLYSSNNIFNHAVSGTVVNTGKTFHNVVINAWVYDKYGFELDTCKSPEYTLRSNSRSNFSVYCHAGEAVNRVVWTVTVTK